MVTSVLSRFDRTISLSSSFWKRRSKRGSIFRGIELHEWRYDVMRCDATRCERARSLTRFCMLLAAFRSENDRGYYLDTRFATIFWWLISSFVRRLTTRTRDRLEKPANVYIFIYRIADRVRALIVRVWHTYVCECLCRRCRTCVEENEWASNRNAKRKTRACQQPSALWKKARRRARSFLLHLGGENSRG